MMGEAALGAELVELCLHAARDRLVDLIEVGVAAELLADVDRLHRLDRELGGEGGGDP